MPTIDLLWVTGVGTGVILLLSVFFLAMIISNQKRVVRSQKEKLEESIRLEEILREIPVKIIRGQEEERRRVAKELHDGINQMLAFVKYRLHAFRLAKPATDDSVLALINDASSDLTQTMQEIRRISHNLLPKGLDELGFEAAVRELCGEFQERTQIQTCFKIQGHTISFQKDCELGVYRILQEALQNIEKHARATRVDIQCSVEGTMWLMTVQDNGKGFESGNEMMKGLKSNGIGISTMKERANLIGGSLEIQSAPGGGTCLTLKFPLSKIHLS